MMPKVSVVIPAYRCEDTLCQAIDSALAQNVPLEVLVVDDCPEAPVAVALKKYEGNPSVQYIQNPQNLGAAGSRNKAVALARAPYVAFLDGDDYWRAGKLEKQLAVLEKSNAVLCCTARELVTPAGETTGKVIGVKEVITYRELLKHNSINCSSVVMRTEVAQKFPMEHEDSHEDYITWLKVLKEYGFACGINEPLLCYRLSSTGKSGSKLQSAKKTFMVYRYAGFGCAKAVICFCSYAMHGVWKYFFAARKGKT